MRRFHDTAMRRIDGFRMEYSSCTESITFKRQLYWVDQMEQAAAEACGTSSWPAIVLVQYLLWSGTCLAVGHS